MNNVRAVYLHLEDKPYIIIAYHEPKIVRIDDPKHIATIIKWLNRGGFKVTLNAPNGGYRGFWYLIFRPMQYSEEHLHEMLKYAWDFINNNIDGVLEDNEAADRIWMILGAAKAVKSDDREFFKSELVRLYGTYWLSLYRNQ